MAGKGAGVDPVTAILSAMPLRAGGFIVTLYGDVIVPRGGEAWVGDIIASCAAVGISETLVRTAVSRLVAAGQLEGRRTGRRSVYRLAPGAEAEYAAAARAIYHLPAPCGWRFTVLPDARDEALMTALERAGHARLRPQLAFGPDRDPPPAGALTFRAAAEGEPRLLPAFAASVYDLGRHAQAHAEFLLRFAALDGVAGSLPGPSALTARLLLVHAWRAVILPDPRLPPEALPADWPGHAARQLFTRLYRLLSPAADSEIARSFSAVAGPLPAETAVTRARLSALSETVAAAEGSHNQDLVGEALHE